MPAHVGANKPMQCRMIGCNKRLRYRQLDIVCSPHCRAALKHLCETYLDIINGLLLPEQLPYYYRRRGGARFLPPQELTERRRKENERESKAEQARRLREDSNPSRWYSDVPRLRTASTEAERVPREVALPDFSDEEGG